MNLRTCDWLGVGAGGAGEDVGGGVGCGGGGDYLEEGAVKGTEPHGGWWFVFVVYSRSLLNLCVCLFLACHSVMMQRDSDENILMLMFVRSNVDCLSTDYFPVQYSNTKKVGIHERAACSACGYSRR